MKKLFCIFIAIMLLLPLYSQVDKVDAYNTNNLSYFDDIRIQMDSMDVIYKEVFGDSIGIKYLKLPYGTFYIEKLIIQRNLENKPKWEIEIEKWSNFNDLQLSVIGLNHRTLLAVLDKLKNIEGKYDD
jgi:hypothetical protein